MRRRGTFKADLDTGPFGDRGVATGRVNQHAANASPDIAGDAATLVDADVAVVGRASTSVFSTDPVGAGLGRRR